MPALINYSGYTGIYNSPSQRVRATLPSFDSLPDECLFEILRRLPGEQARKDSACVSKRWLMLLSSIHKSEIIKSKVDISSNDVENEGHLTRCLKGKEASDVNLAGISIGLSSRGGLGKLSIWGDKCTTRLSNFGLSAVARGCPSLRKLSLYNVPSIGDEGLCEVAKECHLLEKLEVIGCRSISDKGLTAIAENSPNLCDIRIEACQNIHNESLQVCCPKLKSVTIMNSSTIGDKGVESFVSSPGSVLSKLHLQGMSLTNSGLTVIANSGKEITCLKLIGLKFVTEKGFLALGNSQLSKLSSLVISSCPGLTDLSLSPIGKRCPSLKQITLRKCSFLSDNGLVAFANFAVSLNKLHLEECNTITLLGLLGTLSCSKSKLESLTLVKCLGIKDREVEISSFAASESLRSLSLRRCPNFGSLSLAMVGKLCPQLFLSSQQHRSPLHGNISP